MARWAARAQATEPKGTVLLARTRPPGTETVSVTHCVRAMAKPPPYWTNPVAGSPQDGEPCTVIRSSAVPGSIVEVVVDGA